MLQEGSSSVVFVGICQCPQQLKQAEENLVNSPYRDPVLKDQHLLEIEEPNGVLVETAALQPNCDTLIWGFPKIRGTIFGSPHNKDYSILGSILGSPYFGKLPYGFHTRSWYSFLFLSMLMSDWLQQFRRASHYFAFARR